MFSNITSFPPFLFFYFFYLCATQLCFLTFFASISVKSSIVKFNHTVYKSDSQTCEKTIYIYPSISRQICTLFLHCKYGPLKLATLLFYYSVYDSLCPLNLHRLNNNNNNKTYIHIMDILMGKLFSANIII